MSDYKYRLKVRDVECRWCGRTDSETAWSGNKHECARCHRGRLRNACTCCGGPRNYRGTFCDNCGVSITPKPGNQQRWCDDECAPLMRRHRDQHRAEAALGVARLRPMEVLISGECPKCRSATLGDRMQIRADRLASEREMV